jgi:hypothetical protein
MGAAADEQRASSPASRFRSFTSVEEPFNHLRALLRA